MTHKITKKWGLGDKLFEMEYDKGERGELDRAIVAIRARMEELKEVCPHPEHLQRYEYHQWKGDVGVSYWQTTECANCRARIRSRDERHTYRQEEPWE